MKSRSGFTIVEILIVMVIIGILSTITLVAYTTVQSHARDTTRKGSATVIDNALEAYYRKNGEYPSERALVNDYPTNTGSLVASVLGIDASNLIMPHMPSGATNSLTSASPPANDYVAYIGVSDVNAANCQTVLTGGCDGFTLKYNEESGNLITIESLHKGRAAGGGTVAGQVAAPTLTAGLSGTNIVATATASPCETTTVGLTPKFAFTYSTNGGAWSAYGTWSASNTFTIPGIQGTHYDFQAVTRCDNGTVAGQSSPVSNTASYDYPISPPGAPVITVTLSGSNIVATITPVTCGPGTNDLYAIQSRTNGGTWSSYPALSSTLTATQPANDGVKYGYRAEAECQSGSVNSSIVQGVEATYTKSITAPTMPAVTVSTTGLVTTWSWTGVTCPAGTSAEYQENDTMDGTSAYNSGWFGPYGATSSPWTTDQQGYQYTESFQAHCFNSNTTSPWSSNTTSGNYIRAITAPGAPISFVGSEPASKKEIDWNWAYPNAPACQSGLQYQDERSATFNPPGGLGSFTAQGYFAPSWSQIIAGSGGAPTVIPAGDKFQMNAKYVCVNTDTGRQSAFGPLGLSPVFTSQ